MSDIDEIELKPCPFCGGEAEMMGDQYPYVECQECAVGFTANHSYEFDEGDAASKWNARSAAGDSARAQGDAEPVGYPCWSCGELVSPISRSDNDGDCPHCSAELDEDDWPARPPSAGVPEWMIEVSGNLATQDNRITQDPLFVVFQKREIVAHEDYDHDRISWGNCEGEADDEVQDWLNDAREDVDGDHYLDDEIEFHGEDSGTETFRRVALKEIDEFVTACFTEAGAKEYLNANGHNLTRPHIYVTSLYRNEEMKRLRDWLMSQPPQEGEGNE